MKDIDGQEIQVGDVVQLYTKSLGEVIVYKRIAKVFCINDQLTDEIGIKFLPTRGPCDEYFTHPNEIFCLFYRKPTVVEPIINPIVYIDDGSIFLRKIENGITYAIYRVGNGEWFQDSSKHTLAHLLYETSHKQISEKEAKALRPDAFK